MISAQHYFMLFALSNFATLEFSWDLDAGCALQNAVLSLDFPDECFLRVMLPRLRDFQGES